MVTGANLKPYISLADLPPMGPLQLVVSGILTLIVYSMVLFAVYKVFQISNDVGEVKELLRAIKRNTEAAPAAPSPVFPHAAEAVPQSAEALVRAVHQGWKSAPEP
jgi:hypothetical protein